MGWVGWGAGDQIINSFPFGAYCFFIVFLLKMLNVRAPAECPTTVVFEAVESFKRVLHWKTSKLSVRIEGRGNDGGGGGIGCGLGCSDSGGGGSIIYFRQLLFYPLSTLVL